MRFGLALCLLPLAIARAVAQPTRTGHRDSVLTSGGKVVVLDTLGSIRVTIHSGARTKAVALPASRALAFTDAARAILSRSSEQPVGTRDSSSVSSDSLRIDDLRTVRGHSVHFAIAGQDGIDMQTTPSDGERILSLISTVAGWRTQLTQYTQVFAVSPSATTEQTYFEFQVSKRASPKPDNPAPVYPELLRNAKVEGEVLGQFVVDTLGHVDAETFKVLKSTHDLFTQAVRDVLPRLQFDPAEVGGRKVKQLVRQPFQFTIPPRPPAEHQ